jgi:hypothetical protein
MKLRLAAALALLVTLCAECAVPLTPKSVHQSAQTGCYSISPAASIGFGGEPWELQIIEGIVNPGKPPPPTQTPYDFYCPSHIEMKTCTTLHPGQCHPMYEFPQTPPPVAGCELCTAPTPTPIQNGPVSP